MKQYSAELPSRQSLQAEGEAISSSIPLILKFSAIVWKKPNRIKIL
jgi:hypothetical protein